MADNKLIYFLLIVLLLCSCAGTSIITTTNGSSRYNLYINNKFKGSTLSQIKVKRSGLPQKLRIEVRTINGKVINKQEVKRDFNFLKFLVGVFYLYPLWFYSWEYDKNITVYLPDNKAEKSVWDTDSTNTNDPWN